MSKLVSLVLLEAAIFLLFAELPASLDRYAGTWQLDAQASDNIEQAIEKTLAHTNFVVKGIARPKLKRKNIAFPTMILSRNERGFRVQHTLGLDITYPDTGVLVPVKAPDGSSVQARLAADPVLLLTYDTEEGKREDRYVLSPDGRVLSLEVKLTSSRLPDPLLYKLVFRRSS